MTLEIWANHFKIQFSPDMASYEFRWNSKLKFNVEHTFSNIEKNKALKPLGFKTLNQEILHEGLLALNREGIIIHQENEGKCTNYLGQQKKLIRKALNLSSFFFKLLSLSELFAGILNANLIQFPRTSPSKCYCNPIFFSLHFLFI